MRGSGDASYRELPLALPIERCIEPCMFGDNSRNLLGNVVTILDEPAAVKNEAAVARVALPLGTVDAVRRDVHADGIETQRLLNVRSRQ